MRPLRLPTTVSTRSVRGTEGVARRLAAQLRPGDVVALFGDLGAGKTAFTRGLCRALGVPPEVPITSPTFTLMNVLEGTVRVVHCDLYRLGASDELEAVGFRDALAGDAVVVVEWPEKAPDAFPRAPDATGRGRLVSVRFEDTGPTTRTLHLQLGWPE